MKPISTSLSYHNVSKIRLDRIYTYRDGEETFQHFEITLEGADGTRVDLRVFGVKNDVIQWDDHHLETESTN